MMGNSGPRKQKPTWDTVPMSSDARNLLNWRYGACALDSDAEDFGPFARLVGLWQARRGAAGELPARGDLDFFDFKGWWGRIAIARIEHDPFDVRFVLWGTRLTSWWGVDYTNRSLGEHAHSPDLWRMVEWRYFQAMAEAPFVGVACGGLDQYDRPYRTILGVDLPLAEADQLTHVLMAHIEIPHGESAATVIPELPIDRYF